MGSDRNSSEVIGIQHKGFQQLPTGSDGAASTWVVIKGGKAILPILIKKGVPAEYRRSTMGVSSILLLMCEEMREDRVDVVPRLI